jgi:superfamily II DNA or RNA helicase
MKETVAHIEQRIAALRQRRDAIDLEIRQAEEELESANEALSSSDILLERPDRIFEFDPISTTQQVSRSSSVDEKYRLFHELFSGRPDVHAHRFESRKSGKCGYAPACLYEGDWSICKRGASGKSKVRCVDCEHQAFFPISKEAFAAHIAGNADDNSDVLGAYPMDSNGMCQFILVDFDEEGRKEKIVITIDRDRSQEMLESALAFCRTCWENSVPVYMERSRSGCGIHVWLFFSEKVTAKAARRLMTILLTRTMSENSHVSFSSYDMLIPRQDTISKFGFGNLVALPLQGKAGKDKEKQGSLFVDEGMHPYPDQWELLSSLRKLSSVELESLLSRLSSTDELGELVYNDDDEESIIKPWEKRRPEIKLAKDDFLSSIRVIRANMLYIRKEQLSARAANKIKRLAGFRNPDFYKHQAMRLETWDKPRVISSHEETADYLCIPRGCEDALVELLNVAKVDYRFEDKTEPGEPLEIDFVGKLREEQQTAAQVMLQHNIGVLSAPTGFGKTVLGAYLIANRSVNTLVLVPNTQLLDQWLEALNNYLNIFDEPPEKLTPTGRKKKVEKVGQFSGSKKNASGLVDVAMIQSLYSSKTGEVQDFVKDYGLVVVDECHHVPAVSFEPVLKHLNAQYVYGLTATPFRDDGHHAIIFLECGPIRYKVDAKIQAEQRPFEHYLVPRFTSLLPSSLHDESNFAQTLSDLCENEQRNQLIVNDALAAIASGRKALILTERTEHVLKIAKLLQGSCEKVITLIGSMPDKDKKAANEQLRTLTTSDSFIVIATGKYVGEGFDCPMLDTLFISMPIAYKGKVAQYTGRLHRLFEGKGDVYVYDYVDMHVPLLEKMYHKRLRGYRDVGYKAIAGRNELPTAEVIFNRTNYWTKLGDDIDHAKKELVIAGVRVAGYQVTRLLQAFAKPLLEKVVITVITNPVSEYKESTQKAAAICIARLDEAGVKVIEKAGWHQRFVIIDNTTVWYGSINPLGNVGADDSLLRFVDEETAEQLLTNVMK